jgi:hypothetical protein
MSVDTLPNVRSGSALYHYCSAAAFLSMIESRSIWLSSLSLANDTMEGRLVRSLLIKEAEKRQMKPARREALDLHLATIENYFDGLAFCLSKERDQLSQWRGYANDAQGFAIGFSMDYLRQLVDATKGPISLQPVIYDPAHQVLAVQAFYEQLITPEIEEALEPVSYGTLLTGMKVQAEIEEEQKARWAALSPFLVNLLTGAHALYGLKGHAFREEREWRLLSMVSVRTSATLREFPLQHRHSGEKIVPYRNVPLSQTNTPPLVEIVLGPRNPTPIRTVEALLEQCGFDGVRIASSAASYRL